MHDEGDQYQDDSSDGAEGSVTLKFLFHLVLFSLVDIKKGTFVILEPLYANRKKLPFIKLSGNSPIGRKLDKYIEKEGLNISSSITSDNFQMAASLVNNGFGYTILDEYTAKACRSENTKITKLDQKLDFNISLMFLKNIPLSIPANSFIEFDLEKIYVVPAVRAYIEEHRTLDL